MDDKNIIEIELERGSYGLGFNIRGGVDIPYVAGDTGIFVTKIRSDGAAYADRRLKEGDKILEVNGRNLERVTHNEAVQAFVNAGETVKLRVYQGAEEELSKRATENSKNSALRNSSSDSAGGGGKKIIFGLTVLSLIAIGVFAYRKYAPR